MDMNHDRNGEGTEQGLAHRAPKRLAAIAAISITAFGTFVAVPTAAQAATAYGPYTTLASPSLNERSVPSTSASIIGSLPYHSSIMIACQTTGTAVNGIQPSGTNSALGHTYPTIG